MAGERGISLIETLVAIALVGIISTAFFGALVTSTNSRVIADEHVSARVLAESQMEEIKKQEYAPSYDPIAVPDEYAGYSAQVTIDNMRNGSIQKITITVAHH